MAAEPLPILPAEVLESQELQAVEQVQRRFGGALLKLPFDEGDDFRQFGLVVVLVVASGRPSGWQRRGGPCGGSLRGICGLADLHTYLHTYIHTYAGPLLS